MLGKGIIPEEIRNIQTQWANGIIEIGKVETSERQAAAEKMLNSLYAFEPGSEKDPMLDIDQILFKPTLAYTYPIRTTYKETLSYFIGKENYEQGLEYDTGFALKPWIHVEFLYRIAAGGGVKGIAPDQYTRNAFYKETEDTIIVMGTYTFYPRPIFKRRPNPAPVPVDYTFGYRKSDLKIILHHSSLPVD